MSTHALVDTSKVSGRRELHFKSLDEALADARALVAPDSAGTLKHLGNWSLGQTLGHLAFWISTPFDGYPAQLNPPFFIRWILRLRKNAFVRGGMPAGVRIPRIQGGTLGTDPMTAQAGLNAFSRACERLSKAAPAIPNIILGPLTHEEWISLNLRHAELHLSFFAA